MHDRALYLEIGNDSPLGDQSARYRREEEGTLLGEEVEVVALYLAGVRLDSKLVYVLPKVEVEELHFGDHREVDSDCRSDSCSFDSHPRSRNSGFRFLLARHPSQAVRR